MLSFRVVLYIIYTTVSDGFSLEQSNKRKKKAHMILKRKTSPGPNPTCVREKKMFSVRRVSQRKPIIVQFRGRDRGGEVESRGDRFPTSAAAAFRHVIVGEPAAARAVCRRRRRRRPDDVCRR